LLSPVAKQYDVYLRALQELNGRVRFATFTDDGEFAAGAAPLRLLALFVSRADLCIRPRAIVNLFSPWGEKNHAVAKTIQRMRYLRRRRLCRVSGGRSVSGATVARHPHPGIESAYLLENGLELLGEEFAAEDTTPGEVLSDYDPSPARRAQRRRDDQADHHLRGPQGISR
jgi:hypothetical protein